jgi:non-heme chloroperoxidase
MNTFITRDGTELFYKDWGTGQPIVFSHGWPLNADMWEYQMRFLAAHGFRCIAHDRRGFGRSSQPWGGYGFDTFADDLAALVQSLDLIDAVLVGFGMGGGEVARTIGRHGTARVAKAVLISTVTPLLVKTTANPNGVARSTYDAIRAEIATNRPQFCANFGPLCYGSNRPGAALGDGMLDWIFGLAMQASPTAMYDCVAACSETDFGADLAAFDIPTLVLHGDDDAIVPYALTAHLSAQAIKSARLETYQGGPHGLWLTHKDQVNADLLGFIQAP